MKIDKRKLLRAVITRNLCEKMSPEEVRLYFLLIVSVDQTKGKGKLSREYLERYLGRSLDNEQIEEVTRTFQRLHLAEINYFPGKPEIEFRVLNNE